MKTSFTLDFFKIYLFNGLSVLLGLISLFIVIPYLSEDIESYGIYSLCVSVTIFLSYSDLGFVSAGRKYAAETIVNNDRNSEYQYIGFTACILGICVAIVGIVFLLFVFKPELLIKSFQSPDQKLLSQKLLLIVAIFAPLNTFLRRILTIIVQIRIQTYKMQKIMIACSLFRILSVFIFFSKGYNIVGYYLTYQILELLALLFVAFKIKKWYNYDFIALIKNIKFSKLIFTKVVNLASATLVVTIAWVLYYEIDSFAISKLLGLKFVSIYAIAFTLLSFTRTFLAMFFSPFEARFNYFVGLQQYTDLKTYVLHTMKLAFPIVVIPIFTLILFSDSFILAWVGELYIKSIPIAKLLLICNLLAFISYPTSILITSLEKIKLLIIPNLIITVIYWIGISITYQNIQLFSFAIFKIMAFVIIGSVYLIFTLSFIKMNFQSFIKKVIKPHVLSLVFIVIFRYLIYYYLPVVKHNFENLVLVIFQISLSVFIGFLISFFTSNYFKSYTIDFFKRIILKK